MAKSDDDEVVPKARFDAERERVKQLRETLEEQQQRVRDMEGEIKKLRPAAEGYETLTDQIKGLQGELETERAGRAEDAAIHRAGFTDAELVRFEHDRVKRQKGDKAPTLEAWMADLVKTPDEAPVTLKGIMPKPAEGGDGGDGGERKEKTGGGGTAGAGGKADDDARPGPGGDVSRERLLAAKKKAEETGDWTEYRNLRTIGKPKPDA